jgi:hypothetical protein
MWKGYLLTFKKPYVFKYSLRWSKYIINSWCAALTGPQDKIDFKSHVLYINSFFKP